MKASNQFCGGQGPKAPLLGRFCISAINPGRIFFREARRPNPPGHAWAAVVHASAELAESSKSSCKHSMQQARRNAIVTHALVAVEPLQRHAPQVLQKQRLGLGRLHEGDSARSRSGASVLGVSGRSGRSPAKSPLLRPPAQTSLLPPQRHAWHASMPGFCAQGWPPEQCPVSRTTLSGSFQQRASSTAPIRGHACMLAGLAESPPHPPRGRLRRRPLGRPCACPPVSRPGFGPSGAKKTRPNK